jgi:hypothetical protein
LTSLALIGRLHASAKPAQESNRAPRPFSIPRAQMAPGAFGFSPPAESNPMQMSILRDAFGRALSDHMAMAWSNAHHPRSQTTTIELEEPKAAPDDLRTASSAARPSAPCRL